MIRELLIIKKQVLLNAIDNNVNDKNKIAIYLKQYIETVKKLKNIEKNNWQCCIKMI